ncbi:MAG: NCS2 family permease [Mycoplasmataceae bacterium]|nr:NCS2 family permease [Mycoplasmataceae bacterium]
MKQKDQTFLTSFKKYFKFDTFDAIFKKEIIGGLSTFLAMAYILAVNPSIVGASPINPGDNQQFASQYQGGLFLATAIATVFASMFMGLYARVPLALAPGMGLNAFFAYTVAQQVGFDSALTITMLSGILYFFVVMSPLRTKISSIIPTNLKISIGAGIGFFIAYLGLQNSRIIIKDPSNALVSTLGDFGNPLVIVGLVVLVLALVLHYSKITGSIIISMLIGAIILIILILTKSIKGVDPNTINPVSVGYSGFSTFDDVIVAGWKGFANANMWKNPITYIGILSFFYMDFFDTTGTLIVMDKTLNLSKKDPNWMEKANFVDAVSTVVGSSIGATTVTSFVESTVGVSAGAKTGLSTIVTALCFASSIALWPVIQIFMPINVDGIQYQPITGPILVLIGTLMITQIRHFEWEIIIDIPTLFITIIMMMLTNSIAYGLSFGIITFVILNGFLGLMQYFLMHFSKNETKRKSCKKIVNSIEILTIKDEGVKVKTREFYYLKRIDIWLYLIFLIAIIYIILQTGITYHNWFL